MDKQLQKVALCKSRRDTLKFLEKELTAAGNWGAMSSRDFII